MSDKSNTPHTSPFDAIRKVDEQGREYWSARAMSKLLGYTEYGKFKNAIQKAEKACEGSNEAVSDHFAHVSDMIRTGKGAKRSQEKEKANQAHHTMGKRVREFIKEGGGTMPEDLPTPEKSIQQLQKEEQKRVERQQQPALSLFTESEGQS